MFGSKRGTSSLSTPAERQEFYSQGSDGRWGFGHRVMGCRGLTLLLQVDHPVQQHQGLHRGGEQQGQAEVHNHPALQLQHGLHPRRVQGQIGGQADPGQTQPSVPVREREHGLYQLVLRDSESYV